MVVQLGPEVLRLTGDWIAAGVKLRAFPTYVITLAGTGLSMHGFAVAYQAARAESGAILHRDLRHIVQTFG
jgi:hypothetical protein